MLEWQVSTPSNTFPVFYKFRSAMVHKSHFLKENSVIFGQRAILILAKGSYRLPHPPPPPTHPQVDNTSLTDGGTPYRA